LRLPAPIRNLKKPSEIFSLEETTEKPCLQTAQKDLRGEAREESILRLRSGQAKLTTNGMV
jgi:hypothetical protein